MCGSSILQDRENRGCCHACVSMTLPDLVPYTRTSLNVYKNIVRRIDDLGRIVRG